MRLAQPLEKRGHELVWFRVRFIFYHTTSLLSSPPLDIDCVFVWSSNKEWSRFFGSTIWISFSLLRVTSSYIIWQIEAVRCRSSCLMVWLNSFWLWINSIWLWTNLVITSSKDYTSRGGGGTNEHSDGVSYDHSIDRGAYDISWTYDPFGVGSWGRLEKSSMCPFSMIIPMWTVHITYVISYILNFSQHLYVIIGSCWSSPWRLGVVSTSSPPVHRWRSIRMCGV